MKTNNTPSKKLFIKETMLSGLLNPGPNARQRQAILSREIKKQTKSELKKKNREKVTEQVKLKAETKKLFRIAVDKLTAAGLSFQAGRDKHTKIYNEIRKIFPEISGKVNLLRALAGDNVVLPCIESKTEIKDKFVIDDIAIGKVRVDNKDFLSSYAWRKLRMEALKKYGTRCQCCGNSPKNGIVLNVDHIKPRRKYPELALDINNLQILCEECNHGKGNWDQTDWRVK